MGRGSWLATAGFAGLFAVLICGCAANNAEQSDSPAAVGQANTGMSAEQCLANGAIQRAATTDQQGYVLQPGDTLDISFYLNSEFNDEVTIRPDGKVTLRLVGDIRAAGLTPEQLAANLNKDYLSELRDPGAVVHVKNMPSRAVFVQGQVSKPGSFQLDPGMTALQAIADAGGLTEDANSSAVLIRRDACGIPHGIKFDLSSALKDPGKGEDVALMPRDILVVPRSGIANVNLFVKQYIRNVLPIQPYIGLPL
ncbi:MAG: polysaccharide biosynthesis/export family protein [Candidatus Binataceae bacterium]